VYPRPGHLSLKAKILCWLLGCVFSLILSLLLGNEKKIFLLFLNQFTSVNDCSRAAAEAQPC